MKTLILSYFFPPGSTGAASVMYNLCKRLPKESYTVITARTEFSMKLGAYDRDFVLDFDTIRLPVCEGSMSARFRFFLFAILAGISLNRKREMDCILAVHPYFADLLAGYVLRILTGKPLIVYMHDLFSEVNQHVRMRCIWRFLEDHVLSSAATILVMNEKYIEHFASRGLRNLVIFPPSVDLSETGSFGDTSLNYEERDSLEVTFTGSAYEAHEDAIVAFLEAAKLVEGLHISFATPTNFGLTEKLREELREVNVGFLDKQSCLSLQRKADVLFLPLAFCFPYSEEIKCAFPCKLLEYLAAGKPILAIAPENSFVASFVRRYEVGVVVTNLSVEQIAEAIEQLKDNRTRDFFGRNSIKAAQLFDSSLWSRRLTILLGVVGDSVLRKR